MNAPIFALPYLLCVQEDLHAQTRKRKSHISRTEQKCEKKKDLNAVTPLIWFCPKTHN